MTRWIIGGIIFLICVALEIHGSSIGIYAEIFNHPEFGDVIFWKNRPIRSDEYIVFTPFAFSQYFTNFSMTGEIVRAAATNMFMTYGQAVWHPAIIFRPAQIGYLFLDQGSALAFFWTSRQILLFLVSFEFARLILNAGKFSVLYAIMVAFSPLAQWLWSVNSVAEILAAGQGLVICWKLYLEQAGKSIRFLSMAGFLWCVGIFIFGLYPAWQVSFGYLFLFCIIGVTKFSALKILQRDKKFWLAGFIIMLAPLCHAFFVSRDMIQLQMATEYPGQRFETGGNSSIKYLLPYGISSILPFVDIWEPTDNCGAASFFCMTPLGFLIFAYQIFAQKKFDSLMFALAGASIFLIFWMVIGLPASLAKITMLSNVPDWRAKNAFEFVQMAMVFRGLSLTEFQFAKPVKIFLSGILAALTTFSIYLILPEWLTFWNGLPIFIFAGAAIFLFISAEIKWRLEILCAMMLIIGATINPIASGVDSIYEVPVGKKIAEIVQQDKKSLWFVEGENVALNDFPIMFGAPTINSVNVYPALERWQKLDPEGKYFKVYNRYAHINIKIQNAPTEMNLNQADLFTVTLNPADLPKLGAKYILSQNGELEKFSSPILKIQKIYENAGSFIYKII